MKRLEKDFFARSCLAVAPELCGKVICRRLPDGGLLTLRISETEAYNGINDSACHAHKGRTARSEMLWREPGTIYVYLCYGIHWLMNVITGAEGDPQGVLIRACEGYVGPGKLTKYLLVTKELNGKSFLDSEEIWIADDGYSPEVKTDRRVGIDYARPEDRDRLWRFISQSTSK